VDGFILGDLLSTTGGLCSGTSGGSAAGWSAGTAGGTSAGTGGARAGSSSGILVRCFELEGSRDELVS